MHLKKIIGNSITGFAFRLVTMVIGFVSRKVFILFLSEELLGLNSLYANLLELLNLAELGLGVAVQYQLYAPIVEKDTLRVSQILSAAKTIYNTIGIGIFVAGCVMSLFVQDLIKETALPIELVRVAFIISVAGTAGGYFATHKRMYLQANEELSIINMVDMIIRVVTAILAMVAVAVTRNYFVYLLINMSCNLLSNIVVNYVFNRKHPDIKLVPVNIKDGYFQQLTASLKQVVPLKLTNYVYNSTDNIILSSNLGLIVVAKYSNYMQIINSIMAVEYLIGNAITSTIGKIIKEVQDSVQVFRYYMLYQYGQFLLTNFCTVSLTVLFTPFIRLWLGDDFLLEPLTVGLLVADFFFHSMYQPLNVVFGAAGRFREDKVITIISAVMNIVISIALVGVIGLPGVIIGTLITDMYVLVTRSVQIVKQYFQQSIAAFSGKMLLYIVSTVASVALSMFVGTWIHTDLLIVELLLKMVICVVIPNILGLLLTWKTAEAEFAKEYIKAFLAKRKSEG